MQLDFLGHLNHFNVQNNRVLHIGFPNFKTLIIINNIINNIQLWKYKYNDEIDDLFIKWLINPV